MPFITEQPGKSQTGNSFQLPPPLFHTGRSPMLYFHIFAHYNTHPHTKTMPEIKNLISNLLNKIILLNVSIVRSQFPKSGKTASPLCCSRHPKKTPATCIAAHGRSSSLYCHTRVPCYSLALTSFTSAAVTAAPVFPKLLYT